MSHTNSRFSIASLSAFSVGMAAVCMLGCAADDTNDVSSTTQALNGDQIYINWEDDRVGTSFHVGIETTDQSNGRFYGGNEFVPGSMTPPQFPTAPNYFPMTWNQDGLARQLSAGPNEGVVIYDRSAAPHRFTTMRVTVQATIVGACHYDWEDITINGGFPVFLGFNGEGAAGFDGHCYVGDLLHHR